MRWSSWLALLSAALAVLLLRANSEEREQERAALRDSVVSTNPITRRLPPRGAQPAPWGGLPRAKGGFPWSVAATAAGAAALAWAGGLALGRLTSRRRSASAPAPSPAGRALFEAKYELLEPLGPRLTAEWWKGRDRVLGRTVTVQRVLFTNRIGLSMATEEICARTRRFAAFNHASIISLYEAFEEPAETILVGEFVEGRNLRQILALGVKFTLPEAVEILIPVCEALTFAHRRGFLHRNLRPSSIILGAGGRVKLGDFAVAGEALERGLPYRAPEVAREGAWSVASDVYSLGACLYELLDGERDFGCLAGRGWDGNYVPIERKLADLPAAAARLIDAALEPAPACRPASAAEFALRLLQAR